MISNRFKELDFMSESPNPTDPASYPDMKANKKLEQWELNKVHPMW